MRFQIQRGIDPNKLVKRVPARYRDLVAPRKFRSPVDLLIFPHDREDVIHSGTVVRALEKLGTTSNAVAAVGGCFTLEALAIMKSRKVEAFSLSDFPWTDERHEAIKVMKRSL